MVNFDGDQSPIHTYLPAKRQRCTRHYKGTKVCYNWRCHRRQCRQAALNREASRIELGIDAMRQRGDCMFFGTLTPHDSFGPTHDPDTIKAIGKAASKFITALRKSASRNDHNLMWVRVFGMKGYQAKQPGQLHLHIVMSWWPQDDRKLRQLAHKLGFYLHSGAVRQPDAMPRYCTKNLNELDDIQLPPFFRRSSYSQNWPLLPYQQRRKAKRAMTGAQATATTTPRPTIYCKITSISKLNTSTDNPVLSAVDGSLVWTHHRYHCKDPP